MNSTFCTLIYAAPRMEIDELSMVRGQLTNLLGHEFVKKVDLDDCDVNKIIVMNINLKIPEEGEKVKRLVEIAKERNICYKPSAESNAAYHMYLDRIGGITSIPQPFGTEVISMDGGAVMQPPVYNPSGPYN